ncbi:uncharacterized protein MELLADRAFT_112512 [Melampsora larici-populina 98AG31]|uniref:Uncharacterized protein n=1 Tax=Melampsora larici-populina (strain 98AG31 / pathotype 3-4-7) TaxID=747676 RepID=F4S6Q4_MELLP|nr:uncharacterized protein MELLADRAFT_112512 [Melampsora larici-populina 98AG31]EGF99611.1 hypothetical protein MELLADRAFT_112512 [Melampsora larici-populina 98AG31]
MANNIFTAIIDSILPTKPQPVVPDQQLLKAMDISFLALILTLIGLAFITSANPHVIALILVAICLWLSIRWFVAELSRYHQINKPIEISSDQLMNPSNLNSETSQKLKSKSE